MISTKEILEKTVWEDFVLNSPQPSFLQSWAWGEFQKSLSRSIFRIGVFEGEKLVGVSLLQSESTKVGTFLYCPAGPLFLTWKKAPFSSWLEFVKNVAKEKGYVFLKVDPRVIGTEEQQLFKDSGFRESAEFTQPKCTAILDLSLGEDQILAGMSASTRYNIGMSQRRGVIVRVGGEQEIKGFLKLIEKTAGKRGLVLPKEKNYYQKQYETLHQDGLMEILVASFGGNLLASALVVFYGKTAYYLHAANSYEHTSLRASYNLVWHAILEGKRRGAKLFDFWGVAASDDPSDPWSGITSFKLSFGSKRVFYNPPQDLPLKMTYQFSRLLERARKPLRKLLKVVRVT